MLKCFFFTESAYVFLVTQVAGLELAEVAHPFLNQGDAPTALHKAVNSLRARCAQTMEEIRPTLSHQYIYIYILPSGPHLRLLTLPLLRDLISSSRNVGAKAKCLFSVKEPHVRFIIS